jgi:hypothetical protein
MQLRKFEEKVLKTKESGSVFPILHKLEQLHNPHEHFLYSVAHLDGPASGIILFNDTKCWFHSVCLDASMLGEPSWRLYAIVELTPEQIELEDHINQLQQDIVGDYCTYREGVKGHIYNGNETYSQWCEITQQYSYLRSKVHFNYMKNEVIGWFAY